MSLSLDTSTLFSGQGIDVTSIVNQLVAAARQPETAWQQQQQDLQSQEGALNQLNSDLSALLDKINSLKDISGAAGAVTTSSSDSSVATAQAGAGTAPGTHVLVVSSLATTSSYYSDPVASSSTALSAGSFDLQVGSGTPTTITINSGDTLSSLASEINGMNLGVTANVVTDANGARLSLVAQNSGAASDITISNDSSGLNFTKAVTGTNASLTVDGVPISSASNSVSGVVPGITFNLVGAAPSEQVTVGVAADTASAIQGVTDFVSAYNTVIQDLNAQFTYNSGTQTSGPLSGDTMARMVQQEVLAFATPTVSGAGSLTSLASLGISMNDDGTLSVDSSQLAGVAGSDWQDFQNFFQSASGYGATVSNQLAQLTDPTEGAFYVDLQNDQTTYNSLQQQIDDLETYIASEEQTWLDQYNQINVTLQELPLLQAQINAELGVVSNNGSSTSSNSSSGSNG